MTLPIGLSRRQFLALGIAGAAAALLPDGALGEEVESHGLSTFGDLAYPADFRHFAYVNPAAPRGGMLSQQPSTTILNQGFNTFDSLHIYTLRGDGAAGIERCFATLMARALDEPDSLYGLAAKSVRVSADRLTYRFTLRPGITFHDGSPITAEDVVWSITTLKASGHPQIAESLRSLQEAVAPTPDTVVVNLAPERGRDLPLVIATLPIFSKAWWQDRDFTESSLTVPLGSGAYRVGRVVPGQFIELERVAGWWGEALPCMVGQNNFDRLRFEYFRDREVAFEAFKAKAFLFREEFTSRLWATGYSFPAVASGEVVRDTVEDLTPSGAQGWFFNTRRDKFKDARVRQALGLAFDFVWTNKNIMFSSFDRTASFFQNSDMMATGDPGPADLAILEPFRDRLPASVFGPAVVPPVSDGSGEDRRLLREATALLREAGWVVKDRKLQNAAGEPFVIEFLDDDNALERHTAPLIKNLGRLGIEASYRVVDAAQFQARTEAFDFDMLVRRYSLGATPGETVRNIWSSKAAATPGSWNLAGIADPVVDALLDQIVAADSREVLHATCRALDRVLRTGHYWIPQWYKASHWFAYWDVFAKPPIKPRYGRGVTETWWSKT
jgi:microcin C transport system substrate-binding protein